MKKTNKNDKYFAVSHAILQLINSDGLSYLNLSRVAQKSKVSRAWIYEYMGKNRETLIHIAADACSAFFARSHIDAKLLTVTELTNQLRDGADFSIRTSIEYPIFISTYFRFRGTSNPVGKAIGRYERDWLRRFSQHFRRILNFSEENAVRKAKVISMMRLGTAHELITRSTREEDIGAAITQVVELQLQVLGIN